jgi:MFS transporter, PPP family, 3-phenylpropionic acid transporter
LQAANFAGIGIYMPFMPPWLSMKGLSDQEIGLTLAIGMIVRMLASQSVAGLGDGPLGAVRVLLALHLLSASAFLVLFSLVSVPAIMAAMACIALLGAGIVPLGDHLTTAEVRRRPHLDFARIRLWGSVAFLATSSAGGFILATLGLGSLPVLLAGFGVLAAAVTLAAPDADRSSPRESATESAPDDPSRSALLWRAMIASALINASHAALYGFGSLHWRTLGISDGTIGLLWSSSVVAEIAMFWWLGRHASASVDAGLRFLALAGGAAIVRFTFLPFAESALEVAALQVLHALSFGAQLMGIMSIVAQLAPEGRRALIQGRLSAVNALLMGAGTLLSGFVYAQVGPLVFIAMVPLPVLALGLLAVTARRWRQARLDMGQPGRLPVGLASPAAGRELDR